jgi:hypothetical protein
MKHEFIYKLNIKNLLHLHEQVESALSEKDPNEILEYMKKLEEQKKNVRNNKDYDQLNKEYALLDSVANFNCL